MTVSTATSRVDYTGNGVTTAFAVPFPFIEDIYLTVIRTVIATGAETTLALNSGGADGYTVTGAGQPSGSITVVTAPTAAQRVSIIRAVPGTQEADFVANDPFPAETFEDALDKLQMQINDNATRASRSPVLYDSDIDGSGRYNSNGNRYANAADGVSATDLATVQQITSAGSGSFVQSGVGSVVRTMQDKARESVSAKDFGAVGNGVTDDGTAIAAAMAAVEAAGGGVVYLPAGDYLITAPLALKDGVVLRGAGSQTRIMVGAFTYAFEQGGSISADLTNTLAANAAVSATAITLAAGKGANFTIGDFILVTAVTAFAEGSSTNERAEIARVQSVSVDTLTLESPLTYAYATVNTARVRKLTLLRDVGIEDMAICGNHSVNAEFTRGQAIFQWCLRPSIRNVTFNDYANQAVALCGCVSAIVDGCQFYDLKSDDATFFGYSVVEIGPNVGNRINNCTSERVRHAYTTADSANYFTLGYGQAIGTRVSNCHAVWPRAAGFDTHEAGDMVTFSDCTVVGGLSSGFQVRSVRTVVENCRVTDCVGEGVYIDSSAIETFVSGCRFYRTNTGTYAATDRTDRGCVFDNGPRTSVRNCRFEYVGGPAVEAFTAARDFEYSGNNIRNPNRIGAANTYAIFVNTGAVSTTASVCGNTINTDTTTTQGIRMSNAETIGFVSGNRVIGGVTQPYNIGAAVAQSNTPGGTLSAGGSASLVIASGAIDITQVGAALIQVDGEGGAADDLVTINGGFNSPVIYLKRSAANVITVKHGTGNIFLAGAADKVLGGAFDTLQLIKVGSNWIGGFLADV